jgi:hypothetical protein
MKVSRCIRNRPRAHLCNEDDSERLKEGCSIHVDCSSQWEHKARHRLTDAMLTGTAQCDRQCGYAGVCAKDCDQSLCKCPADQANVSRMLHAGVSRILHADVSRVLHADVSRVLHADVSRVLYADESRVLHADVSRMLHVDVSRVLHAEPSRMIHADVSRML